MSYLVFHLSKYKSSNIVGLQRHNQRENKNYSNQDIDTTLSNLNFDLVNSEKISFTKKVKDIIDTKKTTQRAIRGSVRKMRISHVKSIFPAYTKGLQTF